MLAGEELHGKMEEIPPEMHQAERSVICGRARGSAGAGEHDVAVMVFVGSFIHSRRGMCINQERLDCHSHRICITGITYNVFHHQAGRSISHSKSQN